MSQIPHFDENGQFKPKKETQNRLSYYYNRWQDEKEYENWADYEDAIRKHFAAHYGHIRILKIVYRNEELRILFKDGTTTRTHKLVVDSEQIRVY